MVFVYGFMAVAVVALMLFGVQFLHYLKHNDK